MWSSSSVLQPPRSLLNRLLLLQFVLLKELDALESNNLHLLQRPQRHLKLLLHLHRGSSSPRRATCVERGNSKSSSVKSMKQDVRTFSTRNLDFVEIVPR